MNNTKFNSVAKIKRYISNIIYNYDMPNDVREALETILESKRRDKYLTTDDYYVKCNDGTEYLKDLDSGLWIPIIYQNKTQFYKGNSKTGYTRYSKIIRKLKKNYLSEILPKLLEDAKKTMSEEEYTKYIETAVTTNLPPKEWILANYPFIKDKRPCSPES